jgi:hypothetical protein
MSEYSDTALVSRYLEIKETALEEIRFEMSPWFTELTLTTLSRYLTIK